MIIDIDIIKNISFNTQEGERWFVVFASWYDTGAVSIPDRVWGGSKMDEQMDTLNSFQYPWGCEVVLCKHTPKTAKRSFNTRVGARWFTGVINWLGDYLMKFQYPCGCEVVRRFIVICILKSCFNTREGVRWFLWVTKIIWIFCFNTRVGVRWFQYIKRQHTNFPGFNTRVGVRWFIKNKQSKFFIILIIIHYLQKFIQLNTEPKWFYTEQYKNVDYLSANL